MSLAVQCAVLAIVVFGGLSIWLRREGLAIDAERKAARHRRVAGE